jgi:hypothetical protein
MEPRLKTSKKWTPYPTELLEQIREVVEVFFADYEVGNGKFVIEGEIYPEEVLLRIGISRPGQLRQDNFEASLQYDVKNDKPLDLIHMMTDFLGEAWINYLEDEPEDESLPRQWQKNYFENREIHLRYSTANSELEAQANALLAAGGAKQLVYGDDDSAEAEMDSDGEFTGDPDNQPMMEPGDSSDENPRDDISLH